MSEAWYSQKMYWCLNLLLRTSVFIIDWRKDSRPIFILNGLRVIVNIILFLAMIKTVQRDEAHLRPFFKNEST